MIHVLESDDLLPLILQHVPGDRATGLPSKKLVGKVCKKWRHVAVHHFLGPHVIFTDPYDSEASRRYKYRTIQTFQRAICLPYQACVTRYLRRVLVVPESVGEREAIIGLVASFATQLDSISRHNSRACPDWWWFIWSRAQIMRREVAKVVYTKRSEFPAQFERDVGYLPAWFSGAPDDPLHLVLRKQPLSAIQKRHMYRTPS